MVMLYIENKTFLTKVIKYFDNANIKYTTDFSDDYEYLVIAQLSAKTLHIVSKSQNINKQIIFITYLEEDKIFNNYNHSDKKSLHYQLLMNKLLDRCNMIVVSLPYFKKLLNNNIRNIKVLEKEMPSVKSKVNKYNNLSHKKKNIVCIDSDYQNVEEVIALATNYSEYNFILVGYYPYYLLSNRKRNILKKMPENISLVRYYSDEEYSDLIKQSYLCIYFDQKISQIDYLYIILESKRRLIIKDSEIYYKYLINSKNVYSFNKPEELLIKFKKIINNRVSNLIEEGYELIENNTFKQITVKISKYFK